MNLEEFGRWIEHELHGYDDIAFDKLPSYRKLVGLPQGYNPYHGWQTIRFASSEQQTNWGSAPIGMTISAIEETLKDAKSSGTLGFPYPAEVEQQLRSSLNSGGFPLRITLSVAQAADIVHAVRNILLQWTIDMEKQGILGENLMFTPTDREKSAVVTDQTVTNISIGQVGAFAVHAEHSTVRAMSPPQRTWPKMFTILFSS